MDRAFRFDPACAALSLANAGVLAQDFGLDALEDALRVMPVHPVDVDHSEYDHLADRLHLQEYIDEQGWGFDEPVMEEVD